MKSRNSTFLPLLGITNITFIGLLLMASSCDLSEKKIEPIPPELNTLALIKSSEYKQSATVSDSVALDSLVKYIEKYPDLVNLLEGPNDYTLFAPTNYAFKELLKLPLLPLGFQLEYLNADLLKGLLSYHFVSGVKLKADLTPETELSSLFKDPQAPDAPQKIVLNSDGTLRTGALNQAIKIERADNQSTNGVVHLVGTVFFPPSTSESLEQLAGTMALGIVLAQQFSILNELIQIADKDFEENPTTGELKILSWLAAPLSLIKPAYDQVSPLLQGNSEAGLTFFAIPDYVVTNVLSGRDIFLGQFDTADKARRFLLNHLVWGQYTLVKMTDTLTLNTLLAPPSSIPTAPSILTVTRGTLSTANPVGVTLSTESKITAPVLPDNITAPNGVVHAIAGTLPPD